MNGIMNQWINESINQSINQSMNEWINQEDKHYSFPDDCIANSNYRCTFCVRSAVWLWATCQTGKKPKALSYIQYRQLLLVLWNKMLKQRDSQLQIIFIEFCCESVVLMMEPCCDFCVDETCHGGQSFRYSRPVLLLQSCSSLITVPPHRTRLNSSKSWI